MTISSATVEQYAYLGLGTVVKRVHLDGSVEIGVTYIKESGESNGDAGDQYPGLDRPMNGCRPAMDQTFGNRRGSRHPRGESQGD